MYEEQQLHAKMQAEKMAYKAKGEAWGGDLQAACRTPLRDRVADQRRSAEHQGYKAGRLAELEMLLDKNPEVARILDLIEEVRT